MKRLLCIMALLPMLFQAACEPENRHNVPEWNFNDPTDTPSEEQVWPDIVKLGWSDVTSSYKGLPDYISVFRSPSELDGEPAVAFIAIADPAKVSFNVWSINDPGNIGSEDALRTPSAQYDEVSAPIIINAGYFYTADGKTYSSSLAINDGRMYAHNLTYTSIDWETIWYPTRAALLREDDGSFEACWTYYASSGHFRYDTPAENSFDAAPLQVPGASFPAKGKEITEKYGIGGGPLLLKEGNLKDTWKAELFDSIGPDSRQPRTAIGYGPNRLVLFVCEGRQMTDGIAGLTTASVGKVLKSLGCTEAINLDGGGSSCMLICGSETIKPSDGTQRKVGSLIYLK